MPQIFHLQIIHSMLTQYHLDYEIVQILTRLAVAMAGEWVVAPTFKVLLKNAVLRTTITIGQPYVGIVIPYY